MMPNDHSGLVLRRERFGGIVFDAADGTHIELDHEAFAQLWDALHSGHWPDRGYAESFVTQLASQLPSLKASKTRFYEFEPLPESPFQLFSSPTLIDFQITQRCGQGCPHCYASSEHVGRDVSFDDIELALDSFASAGVCQVALGGGDPLLHPRIVDILAAVRQRGMVPNLTTSGAYFNDPNLRALKENCGAVALSIEAVGDAFAIRRKMGFSAFERAFERLRSLEIPRVLQVTVSLGNLGEVENIVEFALQHELYGVVFLAFKPAGRGLNFDKPLAHGNVAAAADVLSRAFERLSSHTRVGYDCCFAPMVAALNANVYGMHNHELEGCSATRGSVGVTSDLKVVPCTFLEDFVLGDLRQNSLLEIWRGEGSRRFRGQLAAHSVASAQCRDCARKNQCLGGCSQFEIAKCAD